MANQVYPPITDLVSIKNLPTQFEFVQSAANNLLNSTYYKNHSFFKSIHGDYATINLDIVLYKQLGFKIPGTDLTLALNAGQSGETVIPIKLEYNWRIIKYINLFTLDKFSGSLKSYFELINNVTGCSIEDLYQQVIVDIVGGGVSDINNWVTEYNVKNPTNTLPTLKSTNVKECIDELIANLKHSNVNLIDALFNQSINVGSAEVVTNKIQTIFSKWLGNFSMDDIKDFITPHFSISLSNIYVSLELPRSVLTPGSFNANGEFIAEKEPAKTRLVYQVGSLSYDSKDGIEFNNEGSFNIPQPSRILNTGMILQINTFKADLSRTRNIPEADADGRPKDFIGVYLLNGSISFPKNLNADDTNARVYARNLLVGTGGITGFLGLEPLVFPQNATDPPPALKFRFGDTSAAGKFFEVGLYCFNMEFRQNAIVNSDLRGYLKVPGFVDKTNEPSLIDISMHLAANGDIKITASNKQGYSLNILDALELNIRSISVGKTNDKWYLEAAGRITITANIPGVGNYFKENPIDITCVKIWQDGSIEFEGGTLPIPIHASIKIGPVSLQLEGITFTPQVAKYKDIDRQYFVLGFNGSLSTGSGGVDVSGDGVEFHFTRDNDASAGRPFHSFLRVAGIGVDIKVPGNATKEDADVYLGGYLSMRQGENPNSKPTYKPNGDIDKPVKQLAGPEYQGSVSFNIKKLGVSGKGSMRMLPKVPAWIVDIELGLSTPITLGATGLGIYGFRGLIGSHFVATKKYIGLTDEDPWYEYLKKKVPKPLKQGIYTEKFDPSKNGFSFGVGATIATMGDNGWTFSSKLFVMLSMPEMFLIEGQANVLSQRLGINDENDPPFYAYLVIDRNSIQAGLGVNYNLPSSGAIMKLQGEMQLGFFFNNSSAWYLNVGRDLPESKRVQARLFTIINSYAYLMVSARGIKAGAGAKWSLHGNFGPVRAGLEAYLDTMGFISFKPVQIGGAIQVGGRIYLTFCGVGFDLGIAAGLSAEAPKPFVISGFLQFRLKVLFVKINVRIELTWRIDERVNTEEVKLLNQNPAVIDPTKVKLLPFKATHMLTEERFNLLEVTQSNFAPGLIDNWEPYTIPMDSYVDIEFGYPVMTFQEGPSSTIKLGGGINPVPQSNIYVSPQKARYPQVKHELSVQNVVIQIWSSSNNSWVEYNPWDALTEAFRGVNINFNTQNLPHGYWQYNNQQGKYTSLRLLAQSPFEMLNGTPPEQFGLLSKHLLCVGETEKKTCQNWKNEDDRNKVFSADYLLRDRNLLLYFYKKDGRFGIIPNVFGINQSLKIEAGQKFEICFPDRVAEVNIKLSSILGYKIIGYQKQFDTTSTPSGLQSFSYVNVYEKIVTEDDFKNSAEPIFILKSNSPLDKIEVTAKECVDELVRKYYPDYLKWLVEQLNFALLNPSLTTSQRNQLLAWINEYTLQLAAPEFKIIYELCPVWNIMINDPYYTSGWVPTGNSPTGYLEGWIGSYCLGNNFNDYILSEGGMCDQWQNKLAEIDSEYNNENFQYFKTLAPYIRVWKQKFCNQTHINGLAIYELYTTWNQILSEKELSSEEISIINEWLGNIEMHWQQINFNANDIKNTLCEQWAEIIANNSGNHPFLLAVQSWRTKYCLNIEPASFDKCALFIHEVCWLTQKQWEFNLLLQQNDINKIRQGYTNLVDNISETLSPVWKPNSYFKVSVDTLDKIDSNGARDSTHGLNPSYQNNIQFAFKTGLPIGFYHNQKKEFEDLDRDNKPDQFKLSSLRHYIDYQRSYPNADGKLVNAKPLYYNNPKLGLYFTKTYVNEFFSIWGAYNGTPEEKFELLCKIQDPVDMNITDGDEREKVMGWRLHKTDPIPIDSSSFEVVTNVLVNGNPNCTLITVNIKPPTTSAFNDGFNLQPRKLYKALYRLKYYGNLDKKPMLHSYNFETSRYPDFNAHIQSVFKPTNNTLVKTQLPIKVSYSNLQSVVTTFNEIVNNSLSPDNSLMTAYASLYDRVITGLFEIKSLQAVTDVEINLIRTFEIDKNGKKVKRILGILVKSPEPFNDPKLPDDIMAQTLEIITRTGSQNCLRIFSKDNACVLITNADLNLGFHRYDLKFNYAQYDGKAYDVTSINSSFSVYTNRI